MINLKRASIAFVLALVAAIPAFGQGARSSLIGVWRMTSLQVANSDGSVTEIPYSGQVVFSQEGILSVQAMDHDPHAEPTAYTRDGYEAYYGPVRIDEKGKTFTITVESSLVRNLIGQKLTRVFKVTGDQLMIMPVDTKETWRVSYERVR
ncbi:lipocalin-like domain-containing protein [Burkholderia cepacia]|uniref:Lipocalin-like domain protein n=1 Tax=Burkholderia cepacia TaxID=292 RepID=A0AA89CDN4_BURCE|nr:lipocalin-like domain-containing protein [Burkholderia cepacia]KGB98842.1 lipocalin-like domain protein [Burkholderia cepacia]